MFAGQPDEALLWEPLAAGREGLVQCRLCRHACVIRPGARGQCGVRENRSGRLVSLVRGLPAAISVDPVEKKPLYHFLPGTATFSFGTQGCNLACAFCQNADLSQPPRLGQTPHGRPFSPQTLADAAVDCGARSISYTYSEPTVFFELAQDVGRLALARGLKNILVTNGFMSLECLEACGPAQGGLIQAANVDVKAFTEDFYRERCGARLAPVLENLRRMRALGWWIEVTTLVIPGLNDSGAELAELAGFIAADLGAHTPWHISRFHPCHRMLDRPPTPLEALLAAREAGRGAGLKHVYIGNAAGPGFGDTLCPSCGGVVLRREGFRAAGALDGRCPSCGGPVAGVWA
jgi:pyruvate formate lyase activating enzyme